VAISLAYSDTISVALLEAMACGVPVIARDVGGTREFLTHGSSAILLPDSSPEKTARELSALLLDGPRMRSMGSKAREEVIEKADWRKCAPVIDREYQVLAARQGSEAFV
jgi:glycosyltransferase involved in cell wall biosynthesis